MNYEIKNTRGPIFALNVVWKCCWKRFPTWFWIFNRKRKIWTFQLLEVRSVLWKDGPNLRIPYWTIEFRTEFGHCRRIGTYIILYDSYMIYGSNGQDLTQISQEVAFGIFRNEKIGGSFFSCDSSLSSRSRNSRSSKNERNLKMTDFDKNFQDNRNSKW